MCSKKGAQVQKMEVKLEEEETYRRPIQQVKMEEFPSATDGEKSEMAEEGKF